MTTHERYVYEVTYDVVAPHREEYETWLPETTEQWILTPTVAGFSSEQSVTDESPEMRLRLEFETLADWLVFVESDPFTHRLEQLQDMTDTLTTHLWKPTEISLNSTADGGVSMAAHTSGVHDD
jgi:hypothetical protein